MLPNNSNPHLLIGLFLNMYDFEQLYILTDSVALDGFK